nr:glycosyltransferase [Rubripirellula sp.]
MAVLNCAVNYENRPQDFHSQNQQRHSLLKLVCIIPTLEGGGAERVMAALCSQLTQREHQVTLITLDGGGNERHQVDPSVKRIWLGVMGQQSGRFGRLTGFWRRILTLRKAIKDEQPDVVLAFCDQMNITSLIATTRLGIAVVISERSDPRQQKLPRIWENLRRLTYRKAAKVIVLSEPIAEYLATTCHAKVVVIPSAIDTPDAMSDRALAVNNQQIIAMGRLEWEKGFDRLIDAFTEVADSHPDWTLKILGEGSQRPQLEKQISKADLANRISMPGWRQTPWKELNSATFFVLPSRYEGFPSALMETMARGIPSLAVDCDSGPREIIHTVSAGSPDDCAALLVGNDLPNLKYGLKKMINDASEREQIGILGKSIVNHYSWSTMTDAYERELNLASLKSR